jgi:hypothetical protein
MFDPASAAGLKTEGRTRFEKGILGGAIGVAVSADSAVAHPDLSVKSPFIGIGGK